MNLDMITPEPWKCALSVGECEKDSDYHQKALLLTTDWRQKEGSRCYNKSRSNILFSWRLC